MSAAAIGSSGARFNYTAAIVAVFILSGVGVGSVMSLFPRRVSR